MIWHKLNEYEISVYQNIEKLEFGKWYRIDPIRPDRLELISAIKKRIDMHYDCVFDTDACDWFQRCGVVSEVGQQHGPDYWERKIKILTEENLKELLNSPQVKADLAKSRKK